MESDEYATLCSYENLFCAYEKARKKKTQRPDVVAFEKDLRKNLLQLRADLLFHSYTPAPLKTFIIRDPKVRKISKSSFRDRVVHHALYNSIEEKFEKRFIYDSYANRKGKGTLKAIGRFDTFKRKVTKNFKQPAYVFKADIRHYFDTVDHTILMNLLKKRIDDQKILWLIERILKNYSTQKGKGMPLGNLTSQFFANIYLHELDIFVKHTCKAERYIRYVDDFVIFDRNKNVLESYKDRINQFLKETLLLELHPAKSRIIPIQRGTEFLGMKIFLYHKRIKRKNLRKFKRKFQQLYREYKEGIIEYDTLYNFLEGWLAYAKQANTYTLRKNILREFEQKKITDVSTKEVNHLIKHSRRLTQSPAPSAIVQNNPRK